jgi:hypothetical protein
MPTTLRNSRSWRYRPLATRGTETPNNFFHNDWTLHGSGPSVPRITGVTSSGYLCDMEATCLKTTIVRTCNQPSPKRRSLATDLQGLLSSPSASGELLDILTMEQRTTLTEVLQILSTSQSTSLADVDQHLT